jgi:hypothetical protein
MSILDSLRGVATEADRARIQEELRPILVFQERVMHAFALVGCHAVFTDWRMIFVDERWMKGKKAQWRTIPYRQITSFSAETDGFMDTDVQLWIWVRNTQEPIGILTGREVPIRDIYKVLSSYVPA